MESLSLGPSVDGIPCQSASPVVTSEELQSSITGATAVGCAAETNIQLTQNFNFGFRMQAGVLKMRYGEGSNDGARSLLLQNLASREVESLHRMSAQIKSSTPATCESSHLTDKNIDVYFCTRGLRGFRSLSDSVVVIGRASGQSYIYNMMRASGFSPDSTQTILQSNISVLGANP